MCRQYGLKLYLLFFWILCIFHKFEFDKTFFLQALLEAHDSILNVRKDEERQSMSDVDDGSDTLPKEAVTRVRLVQFEKAPNEPMVIICIQYMYKNEPMVIICTP